MHVASSEKSPLPNGRQGVTPRVVPPGGPRTHYTYRAVEQEERVVLLLPTPEAEVLLLELLVRQRAAVGRAEAVEDEPLPRGTLVLQLHGREHVPARETPRLILPRHDVASL